MMSGTCRSCKAPLLWRRSTASGKLMPLDPEPVDGGNVVLVAPERCRVLTKAEMETAPNPRYVSHFATCPNRDKCVAKAG